MALSDLQVFQEYSASGRTEVLAQQINLFNAATKGGIILKPTATQGDYSSESFWAKMTGLVRRRDVYGTGTVTAIDLSQLLTTSVKVAAGTPPVNMPPSMLKWIQRNPKEAGVVVGRQLAEESMADMLNLGLTAYVAAVGAISALVHDYTATGKVTLGSLNDAAGKMGDRAKDVLAWVMHSKSHTDLIGAAITNANVLFQFGSINVAQDVLGRPFVITDSDALKYTSSGTKYRAAGLTLGAIVVGQENDFTDNVQVTNGGENIATTYQAEWSFLLGIKGFTWDTTNGGHSPTTAAVGTATNWDRVATSDKDLAGVLLLAQ